MLIVDYGNGIFLKIQWIALIQQRFRRSCLSAFLHQRKEPKIKLVSVSAAANSKVSTPDQYRMRRKSLALYLIMIMAVIMNVELSSAVEHVVGEDRGWAPHSDFHGWASRRIFYVGDNLWFAYASAEQSVLELKSKEEWEACDISNPLRIYNRGLDSVPLVHVGTRYFSSRRMEDCQNGMKVHINVSPSESQTRSKSEDVLFSRGILQKIREWSLHWPEIKEFSALMGGVKDAAEAPTSGSPPMFSSILLSFSFCCINILITSFYGSYML